MVKDIFWADQIAENIIHRKKYNYLDKDYKKPKVLTIKSSTSISGLPHIGNASDVIRHDAVVRALKDKGEKVNFIWVAEDADPWRKVPSNIPKEFSKYIGMPVFKLPCPEGCCKSYVDHFNNLFLTSLKDHYGTSPKFFSTSQAYKEGVFYKEIKKVLENIDEIKTILSKFRKEPLPEDYSLWKPICDSCGKIITTRIKDVTEKGVYYTCQDYEFKEYGQESYNKVEGCGYEGFSDIKKGNGKLLWAVEWATEWSAWNVVLEGAGKEHFMPSSPFWRAGEICEKILDWPEPYPGKNPIQPYQYITLNGEKMSASKGNVISPWEWPTFAPPEALRLIFLKRPSMERDFKYSDLPRLVDELDKLERIYFGLEKIQNEKELEDSKRLFETSSVKVPKKYRNVISFSFLGVLSQVYDDFEKSVEAAKKLGHKVDIESNKERFEMAKKWIQKYAPEDMRFSVHEKISKEVKSLLNNKQKEALELVAKKLKQKEYNENKLFEEFYKICEEVGIDNKEFFKGAYLALIGKERGPKLANFILTIGKKRVIELFNGL